MANSILDNAGVATESIFEGINVESARNFGPRVCIGYIWSTGLRKAAKILSLDNLDCP